MFISKYKTYAWLAGILVLGIGGVAVVAIANEAGEKKMTATSKVAATGASKVTVRVIGPDGKLTGPLALPRVEKSDLEWQALLTPAQYKIARAKGTEPAFCGTLLDNKKQGYYLCIGCGLPLFESGAKFDSGTGWPSFFQPVAKENVAEDTDVSHGMKRVEILCARCDTHLGHVFEDGPAPTGLRYCLNSESLRFVDNKDVLTAAEQIPADAGKSEAATPQVGDKLPMPAKDIARATESGKATAVFAGGCFWCTEAVFEELNGVSDVTSGYTGGDPNKTDYESVCTGTTGHAEGIQITYDPSVVTYGQLLRIFFATHNPMTKNQQGADKGTQYRSAIFYANEEERATAEAYIKQLDEAKAFSKPIVTTLEPLSTFHIAEEYHQDFAKRNPQYPYITMWSTPKMEKLHKSYGDELRPGK